MLPPNPPTHSQASTVLFKPSSYPNEDANSDADLIEQAGETVSRNSAGIRCQTVRQQRHRRHSWWISRPSGNSRPALNPVRTMAAFGGDRAPGLACRAAVADRGGSHAPQLGVMFNV